MDWYLVVLIFYGVITFFVALGVITYQDFGEMMDETLNPITIYKNHRVNILGCILLTILGHVLFPWFAPFFWLYKLCTVGRR